MSLVGDSSHYRILCVEGVYPPSAIQHCFIILNWGEQGLVSRLQDVCVYQFVPDRKVCFYFTVEADYVRGFDNGGSDGYLRRLLNSCIWFLSLLNLSSSIDAKTRLGHRFSQLLWDFTDIFKPICLFVFFALCWLSVVQGHKFEIFLDLLPQFLEIPLIRLIFMTFFPFFVWMINLQVRTCGFLETVDFFKKGFLVPVQRTLLTLSFFLLLLDVDGGDGVPFEKSVNFLLLNFV